MRPIISDITDTGRCYQTTVQTHWPDIQGMDAQQDKLTRLQGSGPVYTELICRRWPE